MARYNFYITLNNIIQEGWDSPNVPECAHFDIACHFGTNFNKANLRKSPWFDYVGFENTSHGWCLTVSAYPLDMRHTSENFKKLWIVKREVKRLLKKTPT